jgi:hypothetical protein
MWENSGKIATLMLINTELQYKNALQCAAIKGKKF